jgi:predicted nuclease of predicted toxin-antitoxin system
MRFLADENVPVAIVEWIRARGHDVQCASELAPGEPDSSWLGRAESEGRIILTSDKDFGELVFRERRDSHGIVLLRLEALTIKQRLARLGEVWGVIEANPSGRFVVITETRVRVRSLK